MCCYRGIGEHNAKIHLSFGKLCICFLSEHSSHGHGGLFWLISDLWCHSASTALLRTPAVVAAGCSSGLRNLYPGAPVALRRMEENTLQPDLQNLLTPPFWQNWQVSKYSQYIFFCFALLLSYLAKCQIPRGKVWQKISSWFSPFPHLMPSPLEITTAISAAGNQRSSDDKMLSVADRK